MTDGRQRTLSGRLCVLPMTTRTPFFFIALGLLFRRSSLLFPVSCWQTNTYCTRNKQQLRTTWLSWPSWPYLAMWSALAARSGVSDKLSRQAHFSQAQPACNKRRASVHILTQVKLASVPFGCIRVLFAKSILSPSTQHPHTHTHTHIHIHVHIHIHIHHYAITTLQGSCPLCTRPRS